MELSKLSTLCQMEVTNMILTTYDKDLYEKTLKEDAREYQKKLLKEFGIE